MITVKKLYILIPLALFAILFSSSVKAATISISLDKTNAPIGDKINADIKIDSGGAGINAAQATLQFPKDIIQAVDFDKTNSVFNFWLEEPSFSNDKGTLTFIGGATSGYSGSALQVLKVTFKIVGSGKGALTFTDAAVTASDGSGTNVLSTIKGSQISVILKQESGEIIKLLKPIKPAINTQKSLNIEKMPNISETEAEPPKNNALIAAIGSWPQYFPVLLLSFLGTVMGIIVGLLIAKKFLKS